MPFTIPGQNQRERWHWSKQRKEVTQAGYMVSLMMAHKRVTKATGPRLVKITSYRPRLFSDDANLVGGCKGLIDGMVRAGLILDDNTKAVRFTYEQRVLSQMPEDLREEWSGKPCTLVEIAENHAAPTAQPNGQGV